MVILWYVGIEDTGLRLSASCLFWIACLVRWALDSLGTRLALLLCKMFISCQVLGYAAPMTTLPHVPVPSTRDVLLEECFCKGMKTLTTIEAILRVFFRILLWWLCIIDSSCGTGDSGAEETTIALRPWGTRTSSSVYWRRLSTEGA